MSAPDARVQEAIRWLKFSKEDLIVSERLIAGTPTAPRHSCWLSQQAAEKALKAALILESVDFPFTHDLDALRNLLPGDWPLRDAHPDLAELTEWAVETRYPGDWPDPTDSDAARASSEARSIHDSVTAEFKRRRIAPE